MSVFRIERTRDYTVMSNHHLKNKALSLKAKGLLSLMLSLPEDWDYTLQGLAHISLEKIDAIRKAVNELEKEGYIIRRRKRDEKGKLRGTEYIIREQPIAEKPAEGNPILEEPTLENPTLDNPTLEKPTLGKSTQLNNKNILNTKLSNTKLSNTQSNPSYGLPYKKENTELNDIEKMRCYEAIIKENVRYDYLCEQLDKSRLDEIISLMVETVCTTKSKIKVAGNEFPAEVVKSRLLKLDCSNIEYVFDCLDENTSKIRNIKQYLLTVLYNAPSTMENYYSTRVNHDLYGSS